MTMTRRGFFVFAGAAAANGAPVVYGASDYAIEAANSIAARGPSCVLFFDPDLMFDGVILRDEFGNPVKDESSWLNLDEPSEDSDGR